MGRWSNLSIKFISSFSFPLSLGLIFSDADNHGNDPIKLGPLKPVSGGNLPMRDPKLLTFQRSEDFDLGVN